MFTKPVLAASALLALVPSTRGFSASILNSCSETVYVTSIGGANSGNTQSVAPGSSYSEEYQKATNGGGVSLKVGSSSGLGSVMQYEYTYNGDSEMLWYDISLINGFFDLGGITLAPSDGACPTVDCPTAGTTCNQAYNLWNDDYATHGCAMCDTHMVLCPGGSAPASSSVASSAPASSAPASSVPASSAPPPSTSTTPSSTSTTPSSTPTPTSTTPSTTTTTTPSSTSTSTSTSTTSSSSSTSPANSAAEFFEESSSTTPASSTTTEPPTAPVVVVTAWVTKTMQAEVPQKRHEHQHRHQHGQRRRNF